MQCPICKKAVEKSAPDFPFCSERCRTIDLGNWASESYRVSRPLSEEEVPEIPEKPKSEEK